MICRRFEDQAIMVLKFLPFYGDPEVSYHSNLFSPPTQGFSVVWKCRNVWLHQRWKGALYFWQGTREGKVHSWCTQMSSDFSESFAYQNMSTNNNRRLWGTQNVKNHLGIEHYRNECLSLFTDNRWIPILHELLQSRGLTV